MGPLSTFISPATGLCIRPNILAISSSLEGRAASCSTSSAVNTLSPIRPPLIFMGDLVLFMNSERALAGPVGSSYPKTIPGGPSIIAVISGRPAASAARRAREFFTTWNWMPCSGK